MGERKKEIFNFPPRRAENPIRPARPGGKSYTARLNAFYRKIKARSLLYKYIPPCKIVLFYEFGPQ